MLHRNNRASEGRVPKTLILAAADERNVKFGTLGRRMRRRIGATMHQTCAADAVGPARYRVCSAFQRMAA